MNNKKFALKMLLLAASLSCLIAGCSHFPGAYTLPIEQGNAIEPKAISKLQPGMNEEQVRFLLGTPMIKDVFHTNRWDYVYYLKENHKLKEKYHLVVYFENGLVTHYTGDKLPTQT